jgi:hypothetical protein
MLRPGVAIALLLFAEYFNSPDGTGETLGRRSSQERDFLFIVFSQKEHAIADVETQSGRHCQNAY